MLIRFCERPEMMHLCIAGTNLAVALEKVKTASRHLTDEPVIVCEPSGVDFHFAEACFSTPMKYEPVLLLAFPDFQPRIRLVYCDFSRPPLSKSLYVGL